MTPEADGAAAVEFQRKGTGWTVRVHVQPRAARDELVDVREGALRLRLTAAPVDGKANKALVKVLAKLLGLRPREVSLLKGESSRDKVLLLEGDEEELRSRIGSALKHRGK